MAKPSIIFDVHFTVPIGVLETLVGFANDHGCGLVAAEPNVKLQPRTMIPMNRTQPAAFVSNMADAKSLVLNRLKQETGLVNRRVIIRDLKAKGFQKNSVGPLCTELKRAGLIVNPRRGYWAIPENVTAGASPNGSAQGGNRRVPSPNPS